MKIAKTKWWKLNLADNISFWTQREKCFLSGGELGEFEVRFYSVIKPSGKTIEEFLVSITTSADYDESELIKLTLGRFSGFRRPDGFYAISKGEKVIIVEQSDSSKRSELEAILSNIEENTE